MFACEIKVDSESREGWRLIRRFRAGGGVEVESLRNIQISFDDMVSTHHRTSSGCNGDPEILHNIKYCIDDGERCFFHVSTTLPCCRAWFSFFIGFIFFLHIEFRINFVF